MDVITRAIRAHPLPALALLVAAAVALALIDGDVLVALVRALAGAGTEYDRTVPAPPPGVPLE